MAGDLIRGHSRDMERMDARSWPERLPARTYRALGRIEQRAIVRRGAVIAEGAITAAKLEELANAGRVGVTEYAMLAHLRDVVAGGDPMLADDLRMLTDTVKISMALTLGELTERYLNEGRP